MRRQSLHDRSGDRQKQGTRISCTARIRRLAEAMHTIVFDLDGTLIDTAPDLIETLNFTLARNALPTVPYAQARPLIGGGARGMIERALILEGRSAARADVDALYASFVA